MNLLNKISFFIRFRKTIHIIKENKDLDFFFSNLDKETIFGIDTEFDWRNTYFPRLSLIQISTKKKIFIIDFISCENINKLKNYFENSSKLFIFHSSRSDATVLYTNLKIKVKNAFDIQIAEKIISKGKIYNYSSLVGKYFPIKLKKTETNSNWLKRPLSQDQLKYAADDVDFLIDIYIKQKKNLISLNQLELARRLTTEEIKKGNQDLYISRLKKYKKASLLEREIFLWREEFASSINIPPSHLFGDKSISKLSKINSKDPNARKKINSILGDTKLVDNFISKFL